MLDNGNHKELSLTHNLSREEAQIMLKKAIKCLVVVPVLLGAPAAANSSPSGVEPFAVKEGLCAYILEMTSGPKKGRFAYSDAGIVQVMRDTSKGLLKLKPPKNAKIVSITCARSTPVPFPMDYRVILSGYDLNTISMDPERDFNARLQKIDGLYTLTMDVGELDEREKEITDALLAQFLEDEKEFFESR